MGITMNVFSSEPNTAVKGPRSLKKINENFESILIFLHIFLITKIKICPITLRIILVMLR